MIDTPSPLVILSGIFQRREDGDAFVYPQGEATYSVGERLAHLVGRQIDVAVHHFPPGGRMEEVAGGGSCLLGGSCRAHQEDPAFLFSQKLFGVLSRNGTSLSVGEDLIDFASLDGHFGQLVAFALPVNQGASLDELLAEAASMTELLSSLRGTLKAST